jgi:hypothetical protein
MRTIYLLAVWLASFSVLPAASPLEFNRDIRPILSDHCWYCHGPDPNHREADLRLDVREEAVSHQAIVPGKPEQSLIIERVFHSDPDLVMPPPTAHKKLSDQQKQWLQRWIAEGAEYQQHWSYEPPVKAEVPSGKHPVDALVHQRLMQVGLSPSPAADRRTLIRRLHADLLGIPPTPEEVEAFVADPSSDAYEQLVERILRNPHYGERMAIGWLDVVRFADTIGYHSDNPRNVWPYRDWVIRSFNDNKAFDRFTIEQVAGDLMEQASQETRVGSAFNLLLLSTEEGGAQPKDYEQRMLTDRVRAIGAAWLGQTTGCAQCHDHKFDPFTMRDFYSLGAFFADIKEPILGRREEGMMVLDESGQQQWDSMQQHLASLQAEFDRPYPELAVAQQQWEETARQVLQNAGAWSVLKPATAVAHQKNVVLKVDRDGTIRGTVDAKRAARNQNDGTEIYTVKAKWTQAGVTGFRIEAIRDKSPAIGLAANGNFVLTEIAIQRDQGEPVAIRSATATFAQSDFPPAAAIDGIDGVQNNGWGVLGSTGSDQALYLELAEPLDVEDATLSFVISFRHGENHEIANLRLSATSQPLPIEAPKIPVPPEGIATILRKPDDTRSVAEKGRLASAFKQIAPELSDLRVQIAAAEKAKDDFERAAPRCLVSISDSNQRLVRLLPRGNWMDESGEVVKPALPHYLPRPQIEGRELNRLDLAKWLVSRDNPLTARTVMNRLWKQFFGTGLSKVLDDLGAQGEPPVHPALLDWLACEFMDSGWDMKHMVRTIVTSQTYRQVSTASAEQMARDPYNRELGRQSPFRLEAELVRDYALAVSGLLVPKIGGPSVKPYQPDGYWENLNFPPRTYPTDSGEAQYRRGLYTWWQRSFLHPSLLAFDAPSREECCAERNRSNIPQQALVLLNDPTYVEAARAFAARILQASADNDQQRLNWAWQQALQRPPTAQESQALLPLLAGRRSDYQQDRQAAQALLQVGLARSPDGLAVDEFAAWTHVARILLNLHETITRS